MHNPQQVAVVINPVKNDAERARELLAAACERAGLPAPRYFETTEDDAGHAPTRDALASGATVVVAAGGDGTVRAVAEELVAAGDGAPSLGILPLGTGNLLARNLGIDVDDLAVACSVVVGDEVAPVDALRLDIERPDRSREDTLSLVASGLGIDAEVMQETNENLKKVVGPAAYAATGVTKLAGMRRHPIRISVDGGAWETERVRTVMLVNAGYIQGGIQYAPGALHDDGLQNAVTMTPRSLGGWGVLAAKMLLRLPKDVPVIGYREGKDIHVRCFYPVQAQVDGDPIGPVIGLESTVLHHALRVQVPREEDRLPPGGSLAKLLPGEFAPASLWAKAKGQLAGRRSD